MKMDMEGQSLLGDNIKVHFAGSDGQLGFYAAQIAADVKYSLYSCYKHIYNKNPNDDFIIQTKDHFIPTRQTHKHVIQDSGLFTLMFGAGKSQKQDLKSLTTWQDKLIAFTMQNGLQSTCVEVDCQKVLGVKEAWILRERMKKLLPNRQINVFHFEDGKDGLDSLIAFSDYIAISVPELRIIKPKTYRKDVHRLAYYIKEKKPQIDIHLLGCTDYSMLAENTFCTSADSTSWLQGVKYGSISDGKQKLHIRHIKSNLFAERKQRMEQILHNLNETMIPSYLDYCTRASICATICKQRYIEVAGGQD